MPNKTKVIANIRAKVGKGAEFKLELEKLVEPSRGDAGCEHYELQADIKDSDHFFMIETWVNADALAAHVETSHFQNFIKGTEALMDNIEVSEVETVR
ncbi:putative quinol monooxygenase [Neorhodopirellula lusitana]|uniref:putative quinol monooxygenase n=1 Tax=Neorhodopirellula lusitana TaxID=445327 RepID=UPI00384CAC18